METPPPLLLLSDGDNQANSKKPLERTAKTPFQSGSLYQRSFKSELQPNRVSSRFHANNTNAKSNTRCYPLTSQRQTCRLNTDSKSADPTKNIVSRLGNSIKPDLLKKQDRFKDMKPSGSNLLDLRRHLPLLATNTPASSFRQQPKTQLQPQIQPEPPYQRTKTPQTQFQRQEPPREYHHQSQSKLEIQNQSNPPNIKLPQLYLIQDTRAPNQQVFGSLATVTKAPLSVSQYTQPTPLPNNKSAPHVSRANSEASIKYQVKVNDKIYKILRKIGSGGSAKVYEGFEPQASQTVAIKIINIAQADQRTQQSYFNEKALLTKLRDSKHVVRMYDSEYKTDCKELIIVMEKGDADLAQVIDSHFKTRVTTIDGIFIKFYWRGMVQAVDGIHHHGIVHADLKPVNFILVKNEIKLIDFGIANAVDPEGTSIIRDYQIGTINYMAPEALRNRAADVSFQRFNNDVDENNQQKRTVIKYNSKVDIWSLGCILYNLVYGRPPFDRFKDVLSKVQAITDPRHVILFPEISNRNLLNCMRSCLRYNPADRPTAQELLNDPYLKEDMVMMAK